MAERKAAEENEKKNEKEKRQNTENGLKMMVKGKITEKQDRKWMERPEQGGRGRDGKGQ